MKSFRFISHFLCATALLFLASTAVSQNVAPATDPVAVEANWWKQRHEHLSKNLKNNPCDLLFVGDSITQGWEGAGKDTWNKIYAPLNAANFGISGDRTEHILWRMQDSKLETPRPPKVCVIHIGTNNTGHYKAKQSAEETAKGITLIAKKLKERFPKTNVLILEIFPRGKNAEDSLRIHNEKINTLLRKTKLSGAKVININKAFLNKDGTFKEGFTGDHLHLSPKGYETWAEALAPHLKRHLPAPVAK